MTSVRVGRVSSSDRPALDNGDRVSAPAPTAGHLFGISLLVLAALLARLYWFSTHTAVIGSEGAEYARIAESLLNGSGYVGLVGAPEILYSPLYPLLIAAACLVTPSSDTAAHLVALLVGSLLVVPMYSLALYLYGRPAAVASGLLAAMHPVLLAFSAQAFNENVYLTTLMGGIGFALRALDSIRCRHMLLAGLLFGLAYLSRVEALALNFLTLAFIIALDVWRRRPLRTVVARCLCLLAAATLLAAPYVAFLWRHTEHLGVEAKNLLNYTIGQRLNEGMPFNQAAWGIGDDLAEEGPELDPIRYVGFTPYPTDIRHLSQYFVGMASRNVNGINRTLTSSSFGSFVLLGTVALGLFGRPWTRARVVHECYLLSVFGYLVFVLLSAHLLQFRYQLVLLPVLLLWSANGFVELSRWSQRTFRRTRAGLAWHVGHATAGLALALLFALSLRGVRGEDALQEESSFNLALKEAGVWLRDHAPPRQRIMATPGVVPYYAGGFLVPLPYGEASTVLRYVRQKQPDFVVVDPRIRNRRPVVNDWLLHGIPDQSATLVYETTGDPAWRVRVYRWLDR